MSKETAQWLNSRIMVGLGHIPWWHDANLIRPNRLFDGGVPVEVILSELFNWEPAAWPTVAIDPDSGKNPLSQRRLTDQKRYAIVRPPATYGTDDPGEIFYYGGQESYRIHTRREWLLGLAESLLGAELVIESAGELAGGAEAFVSVSLPETLTHAGVEFLPRITLATSANGRLASQGAAHTYMTVCDNTMAANLADGHAAGRGFRARHSANSVSNSKLAQYAAALGMLHTQAEEFTRTVEILTNIEVTPDQWQAFKIAYAGDIAELEGRAQSFAETAHAALQRRWEDDDPMVRLWTGTAFGAIQAANTYAHHDAIRRGGIDGRGTANIRETITGAWSEHDDRALTALLQAGVSVPTLV